jgi:hypothetical protein
MLFLHSQSAKTTTFAISLMGEYQLTTVDLPELGACTDRRPPCGPPNVERSANTHTCAAIWRGTRNLCVSEDTAMEAQPTTAAAQPALAGALKIGGF